MPTRPSWPTTCGTKSSLAPAIACFLRLYMEEKRTGGGVSPSYLSNTQNVSRNTISALLRSLEDQGLILRTLDPDDRRQFNIQLSEAGRELVINSTPTHVNFLNQIIADLSSEEQNQLADLLVKLHGSLITHGNLTSSCPKE